MSDVTRWCHVLLVDGLSFLSLAKPVDNLAWRVFQRYYQELCQALSNCPEDVAAVLYNNALLTKEERSQVVDVQTQTSLEKALILVQAVERRIITENSVAPLRKFCQVLQRRHGVGSIVSRMKFRLSEWIRRLCISLDFICFFLFFPSAYVEQHHQHPNEEWSSDTEGEQRPPSRGEGPSEWCNVFDILML